MTARLILALLLATPAGVVAQSTSPTHNAGTLHGPSARAHEGDAITFSEFPSGTLITDHYADHGIVFGGDSPFITTDGSNPTSPVLSGSPTFQGAIEGSFVAPGAAGTPRAVKSFSLDAGFFDEVNSTRITWYDPDGKKLGQKTNSTTGIERLEIEGGNISAWRIEIFGVEPAGYAIDNFSLVPIGPSILFREKKDGKKDGTWGFGADEIPGFDHTAFHVGNLVYESHPKYSAGIYFSEDGNEQVAIASINGVQAQHSRLTFEHDSKQPGAANSPVIDFEEIPITNALATAMEAMIASQFGKEFQFISFGSPEGIEETLSPEAQKGGDGTFTCVGLVEWAAEAAGHNGGQGFIRNVFESFTYLDFTEFPPVLRTAPLLSPQLLNYSMKGSLALENISEWLQGFFDPVDFVVTDPIGRRLGFTEATGTLSEIPFAFFSGNGGYEQFLVPNPVPGRYTIELFGVGANVAGAVATAGESEGTDEFMPMGSHKMIVMEVPVVVGSPGDVTKDGVIDDDDRLALIDELDTFANEVNDPADLNGDGRIDEIDLQLLDQLLEQQGQLQQIPSLGTWGILLLAILLASFAVARLR